MRWSFIFFSALVLFQSCWPQRWPLPRGRPILSCSSVILLIQFIEPSKTSEWSHSRVSVLEFWFNWPLRWWFPVEAQIQSSCNWRKKPEMRRDWYSIKPLSDTKNWSPFDWEPHRHSRTIEMHTVECFVKPMCLCFHVVQRLQEKHSQSTSQFNWILINTI